MNELIEFLIKAKQKTYAGKGAEATSCRPESHDLEYSEGDFAWFQGYEAICYRGMQIYECYFHGSIIE